MAQALRGVFHHGHAVIPYVEHLEPSGLDIDSLAISDMKTFIKQLSNIKPEETSKSYSSYVMVLKKIGVLDSDKFIPNHTLNTMKIDDLRYIEIRACDALYDNAEIRGADIWSFETIDELMAFFNEAKV